MPNCPERLNEQKPNSFAEKYINFSAPNPDGRIRKKIYLTKEIPDTLITCLHNMDHQPTEKSRTTLQETSAETKNGKKEIF